MGIKTSEVEYTGYASVKLETDHLELYLTQSVGPRIIHLSIKNGKNPFAVLPDSKISFPEVGDYYDMGCSSECYYNEHFLEPESLGPKVTLEPG